MNLFYKLRVKWLLHQARGTFMRAEIYRRDAVKIAQAHGVKLPDDAFISAQPDFRAPVVVRVPAPEKPALREQVLLRIATETIASDTRVKDAVDATIADHPAPWMRSGRIDTSGPSN